MSTPLFVQYKATMNSVFSLILSLKDLFSVYLEVNKLAYSQLDLPKAWLLTWTIRFTWNAEQHIANLQVQRSDLVTELWTQNKMCHLSDSVLNLQHKNRLHSTKCYEYQLLFFLGFIQVKYI